MAVRLRRIGKEIQQFLKEPPEHIYIDYKEEDMTHLEVLFIGPRYTPYSRMFMRFAIDFPEGYPIKPPKVVFTSSYGRKIHPNVFPGGWICLSTLNTGDASGWVPSINLTALLIVINCYRYNRNDSYGDKQDRCTPSALFRRHPEINDDYREDDQDVFSSYGRQSHEKTGNSRPDGAVF